MMILDFLTGSLLGAFIMGVVALYWHLNYVAGLRNHHKSDLRLKGERHYSQGWRDRSMREREFLNKEGVKPWQR